MNLVKHQHPISLFIFLTLGFSLSIFFNLIDVRQVEAQPTISEIMQESTEISKKKEEPNRPVQLGAEIPEDEYERGTPRRSVREFLRMAEQADYEEAVHFLDLRHLPKRARSIPAPELARQLRIVLARTTVIKPSEISDDPKGLEKDGLPIYRDRIARIKAPGKTFEILMQKVPRGNGVFIWKFSNKTVGEIPEMHSMFSHGTLEEILPQSFFRVRVLGIYVGEWVGIFGLAIIAYILAILFTAPIYYWLGRQDSPFYKQLLTSFRNPFRFFVWILIGNFFMGHMQLSLMAQALRDAKTITYILLTWFVLRIIDFSAQRYAARLKRKGKQGLTVLLPPLVNTIKVLIIISVFIYWLENLGVEVGTLLAGLGIGGLAVALAAQKSLENVIGAIMLYTSRPIKVGEFCRFGDNYGTVEEIGLRSTKIRTHDSTVIHVPNAEMSSIQIENYSVREHMWYHPQIRLRYETTPDQLRYILVEIRKMFYAHPKVLADPARIRFGGFGEYSLDLEVFSFLDVNNPNDFTEVAEDLNLRIMDIIGQAGTAFAIPAQALYLQRGHRMDQEAVQRIEQEVHGWKTSQSLYLPRFPKKKIEELRGTLDYPPMGSPQAVQH